MDVWFVVCGLKTGVACGSKAGYGLVSVAGWDWRTAEWEPLLSVRGLPQAVNDLLHCEQLIAPNNFRLMKMIQNLKMLREML